MGSTSSTCTQGLRLAPGFECQEVIRGLQGPRFMKYIPGQGCGALLVTERESGKVLLFQDNALSVLFDGLDDPTSVDVGSRGEIYVGEASKLSRFDPAADGTYTKRTLAALPTGGNHTTRTVLVQGDHVYVSVGSTCDSCVEEDPRRATVLQFDLDGGNQRIYSSGLRNSVGMAINPWTDRIWVTTNARDHLGNDIPEDTVDVLQEGAFFGWPTCNSGHVVNPGAPADSCRGIPQPVVRIQAHSAALGLAFYDPANPDMPPGFQRGLYIALHGSWNRDELTGYSIIFVPLDAQGRVISSGAPYYLFAQWPTRGSFSAGASRYELLRFALDQVRPVGLTFSPCGLFVPTTGAKPST